MAQDSTEFFEGQVKWYDRAKGFGFITFNGGGMDIFVHVNQLKKSGLEETVQEGDKLRFSAQKGPKGSYATNLSVISRAT